MKEDIKWLQFLKIVQLKKSKGKNLLLCILFSAFLTNSPSAFSGNAHEEQNEVPAPSPIPIFFLIFSIPTSDGTGRAPSVSTLRGRCAETRQQQSNPTSPTSCLFSLLPLESPHWCRKRCLWREEEYNSCTRTKHNSYVLGEGRSLFWWGQTMCFQTVGTDTRRGVRGLQSTVCTGHRVPFPNQFCVCHVNRNFSLILTSWILAQLPSVHFHLFQCFLDMTVGKGVRLHQWPQADVILNVKPCTYLFYILF